MTTATSKASPVGPMTFAIGILIAIASAAKPPAAGVKWPDTVAVFLLGALVSAVGVFLWRQAKAKEREANLAGAGSERVDPFERLAKCIAPLAALEATLANIEGEPLCNKVDELLEAYVLPIAETRQTITDKLGMNKGAELLVLLSYGERMLNRTWSAAADGHTPEAHSSFQEAVAAFREAQNFAENLQAA
ncbi:MAG: hypothetical protein VX834_03850 [Myxococcota bacterium]|nr:hypothetical protein [Myxococcota bacterium]